MNDNGCKGSADVTTDSPMVFALIITIFFFLSYLVDRVIHATVL